MSNNGASHSSDPDAQPSFARVPAAALIPLPAVVLLHLVGALFSSYGSWGFNHWGLFPMPAALTVLAAAVVLMLPPASALVGRLVSGFVRHILRPLIGTDQVRLVVVVSLCLFALFFIFRSRAHVYGDGFFILGAASSSGELKLFGQLYLQVLSMVLDHYSVPAMGALFGLAPEITLAIVNCVGGVVCVWGLYQLSHRLAADPASRWLIFIGSLSSGAVVLFFGYIEHYTWPTAMAVWCLYFTIGYAQDRRGAGWAVLFGVIAAAFHMVAVTYLAVALLVIAGEGFRSRQRPFGVPTKYLAGGSIIGSVIMAGVFQFTSLPKVFVPLWAVEGNPYWVLSPAHLVDTLNLVALLAPIGGLVLLATSFRGAGRLPPVSIEGKILGLLAEFTFLGSFWILPHLGAVRDWDLLSFFGFPFTLWGLYRLTRIMGGASQTNRLLVPAAVVLFVHIFPNVAEKTELDTAALRLDRLLWVSPQYQVTYDNALRAEVWGTNLRDAVGKPQLAAKYFRRRLAADSTSETAWFCIGDMFAQHGLYDSAAAYLRRLAHLDTDNIGYALRLAAVEAELGNYEVAARLAQVCAAREPGNIRAQFLAGTLLEAVGDTDRALSFYRETIRLEPTALEPIVSSGLIHFERGQYDSALVYLQRALIMDPENESLYRPIITVQVALGKDGEARGTLRVYRRFFGDRPPLDYLLQPDSQP